jgi:hypothetical protein
MLTLKMRTISASRSLLATYKIAWCHRTKDHNVNCHHSSGFQSLIHNLTTCAQDMQWRSFKLRVECIVLSSKALILYQRSFAVSTEDKSMEIIIPYCSILLHCIVQ